MTRNEYLIFSAKDIAEVEDVAESFVCVATAMGFEASASLGLSDDGEMLTVSTVVGCQTRDDSYRKSVVTSWKGTVNEIKAGLFGILAHMAR